jgi:hypothetical protein
MAFESIYYVTFEKLRLLALELTPTIRSVHSFLNVR